MATKSILIAPTLPQMYYDNIIDIQDLLEDGGVIISVSISPNAAKGDYLLLYWNGMQVNSLYIGNDNPADFFPWVSVIPESMVPDGRYHVWYTRRDMAGNVAVSEVVTAIVQRDNTGLLSAPSFPEAKEGILIDDSIDDGSTPVHIPAWENIQPGDIASVYWVGSDATGKIIPASVCSQNHTVLAQECANGFDVAIAASFVIATDPGQADAWYTVQPVSAETGLSSDIKTVKVDLSILDLVAPSYPEGQDGWIDAMEAEDGTPLAVPVYSGMTVGDEVTTYWQALKNGEPVGESYEQMHTVVQDDLVNGFQTTISNQMLSIISVGQGQSYYSVAFSNGDRGISENALVYVDTIHLSWLPAPIFPEAIDGELDQADYQDGTPIKVMYPGINVGDSVALYWDGFYNDGVTPIANTLWNLIYKVTSTDAAQGYFVSNIPSEFIDPVANALAKASYVVTFTDNGGIAYSQTTQIKTTWRQQIVQPMGARAHRHCYFDGKNGTLSTQDQETKIRCKAQWRYVDDPDWILSEWFVDTHPDRLLQVRGESADEIMTLNRSNVVGTGDSGNNNGAFAVYDAEQKVFCWGDSQAGGTSPENVANSNVLSLMGSRGAICARNADGQLFAWGGADYGANVPPEIQSLTDIHFLAANDNAFAALRSSGELVAWGDGYYGGIIPSTIAELTDVVAIYSTSTAFIALRANGMLVAWGDETRGGKIPADIAGLTDIVDVTGSLNAVAALRDSGQIVAWGDSEHGGVISSSVAELTDIIAVTGNSIGFAARRRNGQVVAWGEGNELPEDITVLNDIVTVVATRSAFIALRNNGTVVAWPEASADYGGSIPDDIAAITNIIAVTANHDACVVLRADGTVMAWGYGKSGTIPSESLAELQNIRAVYAGVYDFCALRGDGNVIVWGDSWAGNMANIPISIQGNILYEVTI